MAIFSVTLSDRNIAEQIARMVNLYNRWYMRFTGPAIMLTPAHYFVELHGDRVVGCVGSLKEYPTLTKIQHICVLPECRRRGIARKLTEVAIEKCSTKYIYMTVREDNKASLGLAESLGFEYITRHWSRSHWTFTLARRNDVREH